MLIHTTRIILFSILSLLTSASLYGQQIILKQIPFSDELTVNETTDIYQDKEGFIWVGTHDGAARYDGHTTRVFRNSYYEPDLFTNSKITCFTDTDTDVWAGTYCGVNLIDKKTLKIAPHANETLRNITVRSLLTDSKGGVWIGTDSDLYRFAHDTLLHVNKADKYCVNHIYEDKSGNIWITAWRRGLFCYTLDGQATGKFPPVGRRNTPFRMYQDNEKRYWVTTWGDGLFLFNPQAKPEEMYTYQSTDNPTNIYYNIVQDDTYGYIWTLTYSGLHILQIPNGGMPEKVHIPDFEHPQNNFEYGKVYNCIIKDREGNLWLNSANGIYCILFDPVNIQNHTFSAITDNIGLNPGVSCFGKDNDGTIWFNQNWYGLCLYNEQTQKIIYGKQIGIDTHIHRATPSSTGGMWLSIAFSPQILKMKQNNTKIEILYEMDLAHKIRATVTHLLEDKQGNLWIGTEKELLVRCADSGEIIPIEGICGITDISLHKHEGVWVSMDNDVYQVKPHAPQVTKVYTRVPINKNDKIEAMCIDGREDIWLATSLGRIYQINRITLEEKDFSGLLNNAGLQVMRLLSDGDDIWIIQNKQIIQYSLTGASRGYTVKDPNIFISSFRYGAAFMDKGKLYAAGTEGYISIKPNKDIPHPSVQKAQITDIRVGNTSVLGGTHSPEYRISVDEIKLPSIAQNIEIVFSSLSYQSANHTEYAYFLEGEDKQWTYLKDGKHSAYFSRFGKGRHTLLVKTRIAGNDWPEEATRLTIIRLPAIYETWYAQLFYVLCIGCLAWFLFKLYTRKAERKSHIKFQEELTQAKLNYFTNISHELLTPLTVISCVADDLQVNVKDAGYQAGILGINVQRLKRLLVQVLDFRKIEGNHIPLSVTFNHVSTFIAGITTSNFEYLAKQKNIQFITNIKQDIWGYVDLEKVDKMLFNLLSNAIKYTPEYKKVVLTADVVTTNGINQLLIEVADEGIGIEPEELKKIFTKFYNNRKHVGYESNGIGLSLTKELVGLHHGIIEVESKPNEGTTFTITLPLDKVCYHKAEIIEPEKTETTDVNNTNKEVFITHEEKPCILYVEDNLELRELMKSILEQKYNVILAQNGEEGLKLVNAHPVDVIICDLMMPRMDGLEFTRHIKGYVETSHIPLLMLTAKSEPADQVECYKAGVESFISKPFDRGILLARIDNLLNIHRMRQHYFREKTDLNISELDYQSTDEQFLKDAIAYVERHMDEPDFDIQQMADELCISRSTLRRKLKVMTDLTPSNFIRNIKFKHACRILRDKTVTISEVAYAIGYTNPKYFTKCFKDEFGITPTEFIKETDEEKLEQSDIL